MKVTLPQLPAQLEPATGLALFLAADETLTQVLVTAEDITDAQAKGFSASEVKFDKVTMSGAKLEKAGLADVIIVGSDLIAAAFTDTSWRRVHIKSSRCSGLQLQMGSLKDVTFSDCKLNLVNFRFATLTNVIFENCVLDEADFYAAQLAHVQFRSCSLEKTVFSGAKLRSVDLRTSDVFNIIGIGSLAGATIDSTQLMTLAALLAAELKIKVGDN